MLFGDDLIYVGWMSKPLRESVASNTGSGNPAALNVLAVPGVYFAWAKTSPVAPSIDHLRMGLSKQLCHEEEIVIGYEAGAVSEGLRTHHTSAAVR